MRYVKSQKGNVFLLAILVLVIGSVISLTLIGMSINGTARNEHREDLTQAKKNAESGIEHLTASMQKKLKDNLPAPGINTSSSLANFKKDFIDNLELHRCPPENKIHIEKPEKNYIHNEDGNTHYSTCINYDENEINQLLNQNHFYVPITIQSIGYADGEEKTITAKAKFGATYKNYPSFLDFAVATHPGTNGNGDSDKRSENLILNGGIQIKGNVFTNGNIVLSNRGYVPVPESDYKDNPWKLSTYPEISGVLYNNSDKSLFKMNQFEVGNSCKRPEAATNILAILSGALGTVLDSVINVLGYILLGTFDAPSKYLTYYDLEYYNYDNQLSNCFTKLPISDISSYLLKKDNLKLQKTGLELEPVQIAGANSFIEHGKQNIKSIVENNGTTFTNAISFYAKGKKEGNYKIENASILINNSTYKGTYYIRTPEKLDFPAVYTSSTSYLTDLLNNLVSSLNLGNLLKELGIKDLLSLLTGSNKQNKGLEGQFYIEHAANQDKLLTELLKKLELLSSGKPDEKRLLDFLINNRGLIPQGKAFNLDPGLMDNSNFTLNGVYFMKGDVKIYDTNITGDAILFVDGSVEILRSKLNHKNNHKLLIFATGDIIYKFDSQTDRDMINDNKPVEINAYLYSNRTVEFHGTLKNIHVKGGIAGNQVILTGIRGEVNKKLIGLPYLWDLKNTTNENASPRLIVEHDPDLWKTFKELTNQYSSMPDYYEFFLEPLKITSRK
ncbi:hypothetical protein NST62_04415 [Ureibacillus sp. FSL K6-8385]|uniref:hypothetical protein n=1 Tax=Ureibacillus TaxID=160795 RepID=UPI002E20294A|nr:hypothetical protein [Ureibacillus terrenus]